MTGQTAISAAPSTPASVGSLLSKRSTSEPQTPPKERPQFTVSMIRELIPAHCFERSVAKSFAYLGLDLALIAVIGYFGWNLWNAALPSWALVLLWPAYVYAQGSVMTGVWVIAHECGHQAFSAHKWLNNAVGMVLHSALLVPYHSWRISHANHHKNTCSMDNDEVFLPAVRSDISKFEIVEESPIMSMIGIFNTLLFGWPLYLTLNLTGPAKHKGKPRSHFNPQSSLFKASQVWDVVKSDAGILVVAVLIAFACRTLGWKLVMCFYGLPYLVVNAHLVLITYLQHTAPYIPHYRSDEFDWLRGALSTVDRSFGVVLNHVFHRITDTHVAHHLFHTMPFYHAAEATECIKNLLGPYYLKDDTPIFASLWTSWRQCRFVEDSGSYLHFKSK